MLVIGLTGGIGTGKTEVCQLLENLGAKVIYGDSLGHEAYLPNTKTWSKIIESFGREILDEDGYVNRKTLGEIVFKNSELLKTLNSIMFPRIYEMVKERLEILRNQGHPVAVVEAALLIEAKWTRLADQIWVTAAHSDIVVERIKARTNLDENAILSRIRSQMTQDERLEHATVVIENDGGLDDLRKQVLSLWNDRIQSRKESKPNR